jgi:cytoskeletal protein CcmA (bactofilin family)
MDERRLAAWIGSAVVIQGHVKSSQDLTIDGHVEGTIELGEHSLIVGVGANVAADLTGSTITIGGNVTGNVTAVQRVDLQATGSVVGDIKTPRFAMADGAMVNGHVDTRGSADPSRP